MRKIFFLLFIIVTNPSFSLEDTESNRIEQAERYLASTPPAELMEDVAKNISKTMPPKQGQELEDILLNHLDINVLSDVMKAAMVKNFTANELEALADFYEKPLGKSAMKKMGLYMADVMPTVQTLILAAVGEMEKAKAAEGGAVPDNSQ